MLDEAISLILFKAQTKKDYSLSLLSKATERRIIGGSSLSFGEGGLKGRIKKVLNFKKPSRVMIIASVSLVAVLSVGFAEQRSAQRFSQREIERQHDSIYCWRQSDCLL